MVCDYTKIKDLHTRKIYMQLETIEMEIKHIKDDMAELKENTKAIMDMFSHLDDRYPTRREFNAIKRVIWVVAWAIGIITTILSIKW